MRPIPSTPSFALVGQPNEGKTTVMATLAEDDQAVISPIPGTTQTCRRYPVLIDGAEVIVFFDTPGFQNAEATLEWFENNSDLADPLPTFLATFNDSAGFRQESEILKPLCEGAAAIYVADASRPVRTVDKQEIEILRLTGVRRIGVINSKEGRGKYLDEWKQLMAREFNHIHEFNGLRANFTDRIELLESARAVIQEWKDSMNRSIESLRKDWDGRLTEVSSLIVEELKALMEIRERETIQFPGDEKRAAQQVKTRVMDTVRRREAKFRKKVRQLFHHSGEHWILDPLLDEDLFSENVWRFLGLKRWQLAIAGAIIGAIIGGIIDAHTGGASLGLGILIGSASGAVVGWLAADKAVNVKLPKIKLGPFSFGGGKIGGRQAEAYIVAQSNFLWILLDRYLLYIELCTHWAHGRRDESPVAIDREKSKKGFTANWDRDDRGKVIDFVGHLRRKKRRNQDKLDAAERALREMLLDNLRGLTL